MTNEGSKSSGINPEKIALSDQISGLLTDLLYPSESDEPIDYVTCYLNQEEPLTVSQIKDWQMLPLDIFVEERAEEDFWAPVTTEQDWYEAEEKTRVDQFKQLRQLVEAELTDRQVFYAGNVEIDVYLLGKQATGDRAGIHTKIIQT